MHDHALCQEDAICLAVDKLSREGGQEQKMSVSRRLRSVR
jgi:hypothetical protein